MSAKKNKGHSLFWMLIFHYAVFTFVILGLLAGLLYVADLATSGVLKMPQQDHTDKLIAYVEQGKYDQVPITRWLGDGVGFQVLDADGKVQYISQNGGDALMLTPEEIGFVPYNEGYGWYSSASTYISTYADTVGETLTEFRFFTDDSFYGAQSGTLIVDENRNVVFSSFTVPGGKTTLSQREYQLLQGEWQGRALYRLDATLPDGSAGTILLFYPSITDKQLNAVNMLNDLILPVFCIGYAVLTVLFVLWLLQRVKKPLAILSGGMQALADGNRGAQLEYHGPSEFERMCASFNRMSARLYEAEQQQKKAEAEKQKMLADISHDLKTPITVIQGYAEAVNDGLVPEEEKKRYLRTICQKAAALTGLIEAFHTYSKLEHPEFRLNTSRQDLCEVLREQLAAKYDEVELAGFSLEAEIPETPLYAQLDVLQFQRAIENVLVNSLRHNVPGTRLLAVLTPSVKEGSFAQILLADSGCGIPAEIAPHIFEPFAIGDDARSSGHGSGLGLAISKKIMEAHGGTITLLPAQGEWKTRFLLCVPVEAPKG